MSDLRSLLGRGRSALLKRGRRLLSIPHANVERFDGQRITGWIAPPDWPGNAMADPVQLTLLVDGRPALSLTASQDREDVEAAGAGPLQCGFDLATPRLPDDGQPHSMALTAGRHVLHRAVLDRATASRQATGVVPRSKGQISAQPIEGVAFFDPHLGTIEGWATGSQRVQVDFGGGMVVETVPDRELAGFGPGLRVGFRVALPERLRDGADHTAAVAALGPDGAGAVPLDRSPVEFHWRQGPTGTTVTRIEPLAEGAGTRVTLTLRDGSAASGLPGLRVLADGIPLPSAFASPLPGGDGGEVSLVLPDGARHLVIDSAADGRTLGRFIVDRSRPGLLVPHATDFDNPLPGGGANPALAAARADLPALVRAAHEAFAGFTDPADRRFDAAWYAQVNGLSAENGIGPAPPAASLAHYRQGGAARGLSPSPFFDEAAARQLHPALAAEVAAGRLPCLFAVELALEPGVLGSLTGLDPELACALDPRDSGIRQRADRWAGAQEPLREIGQHARISAPLPPPSGNDRAATDIWSAWLARLDTDAETRRAIADDEAATRAEIMAGALPGAPLVSIIMPTWNRAFTIGEAIQSVMNQSYPNWELLVCDDASGDRTADVVHGFDDRRIRYMTFLKSNGAGARNKGLRFARGSYIAYLDSDNLWHPLFLDLMLRRLMAAPGRGLAYSAYLDTETQGARVGLDRISRPEFRAVQLSSRNFMDLNSIVHHRRLYDWLGGFDPALPRLQDWDLVLRYTAYFEPLYVDRIGVYYRRNVAWGQVTQVFRDSGAQNLVGAKTQARIAGRPDPLAIPPPASLPRVTILSAPAGAVLAHALARLAAGQADADLVEPDTGACPSPPPLGLRRHLVPAALWADPARLAYAAGLDDGRLILAAGLEGNWLAALGGVDPARILSIRAGQNGVGLAGVGLPASAAWFPLGSLPIRLAVDRGAAPEGANAAAGQSEMGGPGPAAAGEGAAPVPPARRDILLLTGALPGDAIDAWRAKAGRRGLSLILPPRQGHDRSCWQRFDGRARLSRDLLPAPGDDLPEALTHAALVAIPCAYASLTALDQAVLAWLMGRGVAVAIARDAGQPADLASQWIEARAARELVSADPSRMMEDLVRLLRDKPALDRLAERGRLVRNIVQNPAVAGGRLAHALWWMARRDRP